MQQVVITGGGGGLARALAAAFHGPAWQVAAPARGDLDVTDPAAVGCYFHERRVDLLVCAAGISRDALLGAMSEAAWDQVLAVNFTGAAACAGAVLPGMAARGCGHVVLVGSYSALRPPPGQAAYATAKAALLGLMRDLAARYGAAGIRINTVLPGFMDTAMTAAVTPARRDQVLAEHVLGHLNTPAAAAGFIHFLHQHLPHTSGQVFQLDSRLGGVFGNF